MKTHESDAVFCRKLGMAHCGIRPETMMKMRKRFVKADGRDEILKVVKTQKNDVGVQESARGAMRVLYQVDPNSSSPFLNQAIYFVLLRP